LEGPLTKTWEGIKGKQPRGLQCQKPVGGQLKEETPLCVPNPISGGQNLSPPAIKFQT